MIIYDKALTAREYLEIMTGKYYMLNAANQLKEVENILKGEFGKNVFKNYLLTEIKEIKDKNVVLVKMVNITEACEKEDLYRWFEVPKEWTKETIMERMC